MTTTPLCEWNGVFVLLCIRSFSLARGQGHFSYQSESRVNNTLLALVLSERREQLSIAELLALCMMEMLRGIRYLHPS